MILLSILWACKAPVTETALDSDSAGRPLLQMGRISGNVTVSPSLEESVAEDRELAAALFVFASMQANVDEVLPYRVLALFDLDASVWSRSTQGTSNQTTWVLGSQFI